MPAVLHVAQPWDAGVPRVVAHLVADQLARGWTVAVASPPGGELHGHVAEGGARYLPWPAERAIGPSVPGETRRLAAIVAAADPDVVHLHSAKAGLAGRLAVHGRRPTVFQPHAWSFEAVTGPLRTATVRWERAAARWTDVVLCVSEGERDAGRLAGVRASARVLPNGVDLERVRPGDRTAARRRLGLGDEPLAVCVGRLHRQKHQDALLDVWPAVRAEVPGAQLALVGDGPDREALVARAVEGVRLEGPSDDVTSWLAAATVVAQPSRWEGMSLSLLEALAAARSVVVTDVAGMREVVDAEVGAVVAPDDPGALRAALVERLRDPGRADTEGAAGRRRAERRHDVRLQLDGIARLYGDVLAGRAP